MKILVTGFDPFGSDLMNPAIEAVKLLPDKISETDIIKLEVPTIFDESSAVVQTAIEKYQPHYVLSIGQAGGRAEITPERVAINVNDARIKDNKGQQPIDQTIQPDGASAYFSQLPIKAMVDYMRKVNIPASVSNTAGTFVCNHLMYQTIYFVTHYYPNIKAGFMHIPFVPEQVGVRSHMPSMELEPIVKGIIASLQAIIDYGDKKDLKSVGGALN